MPTPLEFPFQGPNTMQRDETRHSLEQMRALVKEHFKPFTEVQLSLRLVGAPFKEAGNLRPVQCQVVIHTLNELNEDEAQFQDRKLNSDTDANQYFHFIIAEDTSDDVPPIYIFNWQTNTGVLPQEATAFQSVEEATFSFARLHW